jgi:hypothetical protein
MTRIVGRAIPMLDVEATLDLMMGPTAGGLTVEQLEVAWEVHRDHMLANHNPNPGIRPWAYWKFDLGENKPPTRYQEALRLAELDLLREDELVALQERANEASLRVGTPAEHISAFRLPNEYRPDQEAVELWEAVQGALEAGR